MRYVAAKELREGDTLLDPAEGIVHEVYWPPIPNCVAVAAGDENEKPYLTFRPTAPVGIEERTP